MTAVDVHTWLAKTHNAAVKFDTWAYSPTQVGRAWNNRIRNTAKAHLRTHPVWAEEGHRQTTNPHFSVENGEEYSFEEFTTHFTVVNETAPQSRSGWAANTLTRVKASALTEAALGRYDKLTRGWALGEVYNLDYHLARQTGTQLMALARHTRTHPDGYTYEKWVEELLTHGAALVAYADNHTKLTIEPVRKTHHRHTHAGQQDTNAVKGEATPTPWQEISVRQARLVEDARQAWEWIATHHTLLHE